MELSPVQRVIAFTALVVALIGLAAYLFLPDLRGARAGAATAPRRSASPAAGTAVSPSGTGTAGQDGAPGGAGSASVPVNIYQWLPFTSSDLASAAQTTVRFAADYGTYSYTEPATRYLARLRPMVTAALAAQLGRAYSTPGVAAAQAAGRKRATASAAITALRAYGPGSMTFVVAISQQVRSAQGRSSQVTDYAITLTGSGTHWQVSNIQLASVGNP